MLLMTTTADLAALEKRVRTLDAAADAAESLQRENSALKMELSAAHAENAALVSRLRVLEADRQVSQEILAALQASQKNEQRANEAVHALRRHFEETTRDSSTTGPGISGVYHKSRS